MKWERKIIPKICMSKHVNDYWRIKINQYNNKKCKFPDILTVIKVFRLEHVQLDLRNVDAQRWRTIAFGRTE